MSRLHDRWALAIAVMVVLVALVLVGCGRRGQVDGAAAATVEAGGSATTSSPAAQSGGLATSAPSPVVEPVASEPVASEPVASEPIATGPVASQLPPTSAPLRAPDLTAIQRLLDELDAALGADATADNDEGSAP